MKKIVCFVLIAIFALCIISCTKTEEPESFDAAMDMNVDPTEFKLNGQQVTFAAVLKSGANVLNPKFGDYALGDALLARYNEMEKRHDVTINAIDVNMSTLFLSMSAGYYYADLCNEQMQNFLGYMNSGMFADLNLIDGMDMTDREKYGTVAQLDCVTFGDAIYGSMANEMGDPIPYICGYMWFDPMLIRQGAVTNPLEDYENGNWTWDTFFKDCKATAGVSPINPDVTIYGTFINESAYDYFVIPSVISNGAFLINRTEHGFESNIKDPRVLQAIEWIRDISSDESVLVSGIGVETAAYQFTDHQYTFFLEYNWLGISRMAGWIGCSATDEFSWITFPVGPNGTPKQMSSFISWGTNYYLVPSYIDTTYTGYFVSELFEPLYTDAGLDWKDILYTENFWEKKSFEQCQKMFTDAATCYYSIASNYDGSLKTTLGKAASGKESVSSALESVEQRALAQLQKLYSNLVK